MTPEDWQILNVLATAAGAVATFAAVIIALLPVFASAAARRARARNLRMRLIVKLTKLRPILVDIADRGSPQRSPEFVSLSNDELVMLIQQLEGLLISSEVLEPKEQDAISQVVANLELMLPAIRIGELPSSGAIAMTALIDRSINLMEQHGILSVEPYQPWRT